MGVFVRAVVSGFGFSLGAALFKRVSKQLGFAEDETKSEPVPDTDADGEADADAEASP